MPTWEWIPVADWPEDVAALVRDLDSIGQVLALLQGGGVPGDRQYETGVAFVREAQRGRRSELAARILQVHGMPSETDESDDLPVEDIKERN